MRYAAFFTICIASLAPGAGPGVLGQDVYHDNVVVVLDASGSMSKRMRGTNTIKMDAAKKALKEVLKQVPASTHIGLVVFSAKNSKEDIAYPLGPRDDAALMQAIDAQNPGRGTPLGRYIKKGADLLLAQRDAQFGYGTYRLLIVTDGEAEDKKLVNQYTPEVVSRGISVDVIGVDMQTTHTLATQATSYRRADDPESLQRAVAEVFAEVSGADDAAAGAEAFETIAPLPVETAQAMIAALSGSGNQQIGARPAATAPRGVATPRPVVAQPPAPPAPPAPGHAAVPAPEKEDSVSGSMLVRVLVIMGILFLIVVRFAMRASRRASGRSSRRGRHRY